MNRCEHMLVHTDRFSGRGTVPTSLSVFPGELRKICFGRYRIMHNALNGLLNNTLLLVVGG